MSMEKLISMTDFVFLMRKNESKDNIRRFWSCEKYANFLKQPLTLGMFVPCDEDGNILEEPDSIGVGNDFYYERALDQYQQAKERVLFEGLEFIGQDSDNFHIKFKNVDSLELYNFTFVPLESTIEYLCPFNLKLTQSAIKQLGL